jgi:hypothetical protein
MPGRPRPKHFIIEQEHMSIQVVYTHDDFDGIGSAAIFAHRFRPADIRFTSPKRLAEEPVTDRDAVLDLPYARRCAVWFDHHEQNFDEPGFLGMEPGLVPGLRLAAPSCARVVLTWYEAEGIAFPDHFPELVTAIDQFDSMSFASLDDWLCETPGRVVNESLTLPNEHPRDRFRYYAYLAGLLERLPLARCAADPTVAGRYGQRLRLNEQHRDVIRKIGRFDSRDALKRMLILDFTGLKFQPAADKKLALIDFPGVEYILSLYPVFENRVKTNAVTLSIGRNFLRAGDRLVDWGAYFAGKEIGGGHPDAAGARLEAKSKPERDRQLEELLQDMLRRLNTPVGTADTEGA